ncbi:hypothetical protein BDR22DRAFT_75863 [Usnea florida]
MRFPTVFLSILALAAASPSPMGSLQRRVDKVVRFGTNQAFTLQPSNSPITNLQGIQSYFQGDGNFVVYGGPEIWSSGTAGHNCEGGDTCRLAWQGDGNFVVYINGVAKWSSNTAGRGEELTFSNEHYSIEITGVESAGTAPVLWHAYDTGNEPDPGPGGPGVCDGGR